MRKTESRSQWNRQERMDVLSPLLSRIREYDVIRTALIESGGIMDDLGRIVEIINERIPLKIFGDECDISMSDHNSIRRALSRIDHGEVLIDVRMDRFGMPVYYICRIRRDYWNLYTMIIEDLYMSPGYRLVDKRFARMMRNGHETYFLRLSDFREMTESAICAGETWRTDEVLSAIGKSFFQNAWHEDQLPGFITADYFKLTKFRNAIELLYLCLSGDLCALRSNKLPYTCTFFDSVYPQPAIRDLIEALKRYDGSRIGTLSEISLAGYIRLGSAFTRFLMTEIDWGTGNGSIPMFKAVFSNYDRLDSVAGSLSLDTRVTEASAVLEDEALSIMETIVRR